MRTSGLSLLRISIPILISSFLNNIIFLFIFSPLVSATQKKIQKIELEKLGKPINSLLVSKSGFWLKQGHEEGSEIIYAKKLKTKSMTLEDVVIFSFDSMNKIDKKIQAFSAKLKDNYWLLQNTRIINNNGEVSNEKQLLIRTTVTSSQIREGFATPGLCRFGVFTHLLECLKKLDFRQISIDCISTSCSFSIFAIRNGSFRCSFNMNTVTESL